MAWRYHFPAPNGISNNTTSPYFKDFTAEQKIYAFIGLSCACLGFFLLLIIYEKLLAWHQDARTCPYINQEDRTKSYIK